jgi:hypothetical protein
MVFDGGENLDTHIRPPACGAIQKRGSNAVASAVGMALCICIRSRRNAEGAGMSGHVASIREQRHRSGGAAGDDFGKHHQQRQSLVFFPKVSMSTPSETAWIVD